MSIFSSNSLLILAKVHKGRFGIRIYRLLREKSLESKNCDVVLSFILINHNPMFVS